jgi:hypothetical protein
MAVTDQYLVQSVQYALLENGNADADGTTLLTSMFSITEIANAFDRVQQQFLLDTGLVQTRATIVGVVGQSKYATPADSIRPRRLSYQEVGASPKVLTQVDTWELDNFEDNWGTDSGTPEVWWENTLGQQQVAVALTPANPGNIGLLYVALAQTITGAGTTFTVPDDWTPYIYWGTLNELLQSDGPSFDPVRAQYCSTRYDEGVELARLVLGG